ncbi:purple acid phosphatase [Aureobasidium namibiae CBS 147.97]|uniref:Purple acid phosphatase n=1 Tax=Aureobasidium namibiae CBS 147.97 TaxID=1043004 RepID=A0A074WAJ1_9PEZI
MAPTSFYIQALPLLSGLVFAADYPGIPTDLTTPVQQRIAFKGPNAISVGWNTYEKLAQGCVQYGKSATSLTSQACSTQSLTYGTSRTWANSVTLSGLDAATTYYYKIVSTNSTVNHFMTARTPGDKTSFNVDVVIDLGVYGQDGYTTSRKRDIPYVQPALNHTTIGALARTIDSYDFVLHPGDFAYADDWYLTPKNVLDGKNAYAAILENFFDQLAPVAGRKPYMASPGNHEAACTEIPYTTGLCPEGQKNFTDFMTRFNGLMPTAFPSQSRNATAQASAKKAQGLANPPFWYSFEYGMAHIVMIDTETDFPSAPDGQGGSAGLGAGPFGSTPTQQLQFLDADLASVDRTITPWLIVAGHRPWYSTGDSKNICGPCQTAFEPLFYKYGVDLGVFGHVHNSQRFNPVYNNVADSAGLNNPKAPAYIIAGGAGNIEGLSAVGANYSTNVFAYADEFSYASLKFKDANNLQIDFMRSDTGEVLDSSVLYKQHNVAFVRN